MAKNICFTTRLRGAMTAYGHAMPCNLKGTICCSMRGHVSAFFGEAQGVTVPISRGGPPVLTE